MRSAGLWLVIIASVRANGIYWSASSKAVNGPFHNGLLVTDLTRHRRGPAILIVVDYNKLVRRKKVPFYDPFHRSWISSGLRRRRPQSSGKGDAGKGVNVASFLAGLGCSVAVTGLLGADNTDRFVRLFAEKNLTDRFVRVPGRTRVNVKIVDEKRHLVTDINFPGIAARAGDLDAVTAAVEELVRQDAEWFALCGSLPAGLPATSYRDLTLLLKSRGRKVVLDTSGVGLAHAIAACPDVIKPNLKEFTELVGRPLDGETAVVEAARALCQGGIPLVAVSMGARGAVFVDAETAVHAASPPVDVKSTVGAGDAMVAGAVHAALQNMALEPCARVATAVAAGALGDIGPRLPPREQIEASQARVTTRRLSG